MAKKRLKIDGMTFSPGQVDALLDMATGAFLYRSNHSFVMRRFGLSPTSMCIAYPEGVKHRKSNPDVQSKNIHMTCQALMDKKLVEQIEHQRGVGGSSSTYGLSAKGKSVAKQLVMLYEE